MNPHAKALEHRKHTFLKDERKGIKEYKESINKSKGREKSTYKQILPDEQKHLKELKRI